MNSVLKKMLSEMQSHLENGIVRFWSERCLDEQCGGYLTNFDENGTHCGTPEKYLNSQARLVWGFSRFYNLYPHNQRLKGIASAGVDFLLKHFWDACHGGWYWKVNQDGSRLDDGKVVYGQSFAIYALTEYFMATGDSRALDKACETFDLLQKYCADTRHGGYYENLEPDWGVSAGGFCAGDRKGLDTHMHLMEAFTNLTLASKQDIHRRKLIEIVELIVDHMIDHKHGCGRNQFDLAFNPMPAIAIRRTWNAEREGESVPEPIDTTSYGHNVELAWLLHRAVQAAGMDVSRFAPLIRELLDHALARGVDWEYGGIFRDGTHDGDALVLEKEFWQNAEVLVGFLEGYALLGDNRYLDAVENIWAFANTKMINHQVGEWRTLLDRKGEPLDGNIGNPWKVCYHSGRSMVECIQLLRDMIGAR